MANSHTPIDQFGFHFVTLARRWRRAVDSALLAAGLTDATWAPLIHLSQMGDGISQTELAARVGLDTSSLVRLIDLLVERELVERRIDPRDRRARQIVLTPIGIVEVEHLQGQLLAIEARLLAGIPEDQLRSMLDGFERINANARDLLEGEAPQ